MDIDDADEDIPYLLRQWGLSHYIATFEANNVTLSTLSMLDNFLAKELITPIGDRARFLRNLDNWKRITKTEDSEVNISTDSPVIEFVDLLNPKHKMIKSVSEFLMPINDKNKDLASTSTQSISSEVNLLAPTSPDPAERDMIGLDSIDTVESISNENEDVPRSLPLKDLLLKSNEGQGLLNLYLEEGKVTSNGRRKLCNIIIKDLMENDPSKRIDSSLLLEKAQEIKAVFKKENISTFFIPYINDTQLKIKRCAKGKLYDCLQNRRRELREAKVITQKNKSSSSNNTTLNDHQDPCEADETGKYYAGACGEGRQKAVKP